MEDFADAYENWKHYAGASIPSSLSQHLLESTTGRTEASIARMSRKEIKTLLIFFDIDYKEGEATKDLRAALLANLRSILLDSLKRLEQRSSKFRALAKKFSAAAHHPVVTTAAKWVTTLATAYLCWAVLWVIAGAIYRQGTFTDNNVEESNYAAQILHVLRHPFYSDEALEGKAATEAYHAESYPRYFARRCRWEGGGEGGGGVPPKSVGKVRKLDSFHSKRVEWVYGGRDAT
jgi:hypothetical protein